MQIQGSYEVQIITDARQAKRDGWSEEDNPETGLRARRLWHESFAIASLAPQQTVSG